MIPAATAMAMSRSVAMIGETAGRAVTCMTKPILPETYNASEQLLRSPLTELENSTDDQASMVQIFTLIGIVTRRILAHSTLRRHQAMNGNCRPSSECTLA